MDKEIGDLSRKNYIVIESKVIRDKEIGDLSRENDNIVLTIESRIRNFYYSISH
jgi:hypothetical protein